jgi:hypothetical protein
MPDMETSRSFMHIKAGALTVPLTQSIGRIDPVGSSEAHHCIVLLPLSGKHKANHRNFPTVVFPTQPARRQLPTDQDIGGGKGKRKKKEACSLELWADYFEERDTDLED